jgi:methylenetetrahydrofolate reductase (NADPH)
VRIDELLAQQHRPVFSFEFFPPKTEEGLRNLFDAVGELRSLRPDFVSVTYGAGGSTANKTIEIVSRIKEEYGIEAMAHFTCVGSTVDELRETLDAMAAVGVDNVLALRGDPPAGQEDLKEKVDAGARFLITQLFFDNALYFDFVHRARDVGIEVPIVPGIMPITNVKQLERMTSLCGATIPSRLRRELVSRSDQPDAVGDFGVAYATMQCAELLRGGAPGIHFYTLNRSPATRAILSALKLLRPWEDSAVAAYGRSSMSSFSATAGVPSGRS